MSRIEVLGRDVATEAYRIRAQVDGRTVTALVPERLMPSLRPGTKPSHQDAYEWIAGRRDALHRALATLGRGGTPRPPLDLIQLEGPQDGR